MNKFQKKTIVVIKTTETKDPVQVLCIQSFEHTKRENLAGMCKYGIQRSWDQEPISHERVH